MVAVHSRRAGYSRCAPETLDPHAPVSRLIEAFDEVLDLGVLQGLTALNAKRARAAAGPRTSAAHARWEEIDLGDVAPVIELTKELIGAHLG